MKVRLLGLLFPIALGIYFFWISPNRDDKAIQATTKELGDRAHLIKREVSDRGSVVATYEVPSMTLKQVAAVAESHLAIADFHIYKSRFSYDFSSASGSVLITQAPDGSDPTEYITMRRLSMAGKDVTPIVDHRVRPGEPRFYALGRMAKDDFNAGNIELARSEANELMADLPKYSDDNADEIQDGNVVLGRIAVREGRIEDAKKYLVAAGKHGGSPVLSSFGPNMALARDLFNKGEREAVLEYLAECRKFWNDEDAIDRWTDEVKAGQMPDFGANVDY